MPMYAGRPGTLPPLEGEMPRQGSAPNIDNYNLQPTMSGDYQTVVHALAAKQKTTRSNQNSANNGG